MPQIVHCGGVSQSLSPTVAQGYVLPQPTRAVPNDSTLGMFEKAPPYMVPAIYFEQRLAIRKRV
jgi:hypothetical protein